MIEEVLTTIMVICVVMVTISLIIINSENKVLNTSINNLIIPKNQYVVLVIEWCHNNLKNHNTKKPTVTVKYHQNKKVHGIYDSSTHGILIYINTHTTIRELTNTTIHEYVHSRQKNRSFSRMYDLYNQSVGYQNNPFEVESRMVSKTKERECVMELVRSNRILK